MRLDIKSLIAVAILAPFMTVWLWTFTFSFFDVATPLTADGAWMAAMVVVQAFLAACLVAGLGGLMGFIPALAFLTVPLAVASRWGDRRSYVIAGFLAGLAFIVSGVWVRSGNPDLSAIGWLALGWAPFALDLLSAVIFTVSVLVVGVMAGGIYSIAVGAPPSELVSDPKVE